MLVGGRERRGGATTCSGGPYPPPNAPGCAKSVDGTPIADRAMATSNRTRLKIMTHSSERYGHVTAFAL